jgi:hypothetical protein
MVRVAQSDFSMKICSVGSAFRTLPSYSILIYLFLFLRGRGGTAYFFLPFLMLLMTKLLLAELNSGETESFNSTTLSSYSKVMLFFMFRGSNSIFLAVSVRFFKFSRQTFWTASSSLPTSDLPRG